MARKSRRKCFCRNFVAPKGPPWQWNRASIGWPQVAATRSPQKAHGEPKPGAVQPEEPEPGALIGSSEAPIEIFLKVNSWSPSGQASTWTARTDRLLLVRACRFRVLLYHTVPGSYVYHRLNFERVSFKDFSVPAASPPLLPSAEVAAGNPSTVRAAPEGSVSQVWKMANIETEIYGNAGQ